MELLADIFGRKYWLLEEQTANKHIVLIEDVKTKRYAEICLETDELLESNLNNSDLSEVKNEISNFRYDFLRYIENLNRKRS